MRRHAVAVRFPLTLLLVVLCLFRGTAHARPAGEDEVRILVLSSRGEARYAQAIAGFGKALEAQGIRVRLTIRTLGDDFTPLARKGAEGGSPRLVLALGSAALDAAGRKFPDVPTVAGLLPSLDDIPPGLPLTAVVLEHSFESRLRLLRQILPDAGSVGVVYQGGGSEQRLLASLKVAAALGFRIEARKVSASRDLPQALAGLANRADALLVAWSPMLASPESARGIMLFAESNRLPVVGLSEAWAKAGAPVALDWDYGDLGEQCGEAAARILRGAPPRSIPPQEPRKAKVVLNLSAARRQALRVPPALVRSAAIVY
jgi:putative ABC transport system substrate-binding protein